MKRYLTIAIALSACGPAVPSGEIKLPPAKTEAVHELEAAVRLARLGPANYPRALDRLDAAEKIDPNLWEAYYDAGWMQRELHQLDAAATDFEKALSINPAHGQTVEALGSVYLAHRKFGDAARVFRGYLDRKPPPKASDEHRLRIQLAAALRQEGKLDDALEELRKVLRAEPRSAPALTGLGLVYEAKGQHELAELVIRRAIDVNKESPAAAPAWNSLGLVLLSLRRDQEAFAAFDKAAALDPNLGEARYNRASVYLDCGDYGNAAKELEKLTSAQPDNIAAWVARGVAERGGGKLDEAKRAYEHALDLDPNDPGALYNMGVLLMDFRREPDAARPYFERFLKAADASHPKRADAESRMKDLAPKSAPPAAGAPTPKSPTKKGGS